MRALKCWTASSLLCCSLSRSISLVCSDRAFCTSRSLSLRLASMRACLSNSRSFSMSTLCEGTHPFKVKMKSEKECAQKPQGAHTVTSTTWHEHHITGLYGDSIIILSWNVHKRNIKLTSGNQTVRSVRPELKLVNVSSSVESTIVQSSIHRCAHTLACFSMYCLKSSSLSAELSTALYRGSVSSLSFTLLHRWPPSMCWSLKRSKKSCFTWHKTKTHTDQCELENCHQALTNEPW